MPAGRYELEYIDSGERQITYFAPNGNRVVVTKVEAFDPVREEVFIVEALNDYLERTGWKPAGYWLEQVKEEDDR
jgi:hypothetical protein